jgi:hypothetical protein
VTAKTEFPTDEWERLVQLPRWVVVAASAAQRDLPHRTTIEVEAGYIASANGRNTGNVFVTEVAEDTLRLFDGRADTTPAEFSDRKTAVAAVLARAQEVNQILKARVSIADAMAYRRWLLTITDVVISAARTGDFLGFGGKLVTESEQDFRDRLVVVLQS